MITSHSECDNPYQPTKLDQTRDDIVAFARQHIGLNADALSDRIAFHELIGRHHNNLLWDLDHPFSVSKRQGVSTCGLVASAFNAVAINNPWIGACAYVDPEGKGRKVYLLDPVSRIEQWAYETSSRMTGAETKTMAEPGDIICIGAGLGTHVLTLVEKNTIQDIAGLTHQEWQSVDGGQVVLPSGRQAIKLCRRNIDGIHVNWGLSLAKLWANHPEVFR
jgi:hypothetical protein